MIKKPTSELEVFANILEQRIDNIIKLSRQNKENQQDYISPSYNYTHGSTELDQLLGGE
jgi:hypothetical protein